MKGTMTKNHLKKRPAPPDPAQRNVEAVARLEQAAQEQRTRLDRTIDGVTGWAGSLPFVYLHLVWFALWTAVNLLPRRRPFDPFPFSLLTLLLSMEAIILSAFILISQNRQQRLADRRAHLDLQINMLAEQENTKMLAVLDEIRDHLGIRRHDPEMAGLKEATEPERLLEQIETHVERLEEAPNPSPPQEDARKPA
jgi:uncharacterized membrane protein